MKVFKTVFISIFISNIVKICSSAYIWVTGKPEQYNPMNLPFDIEKIDYEIRIVVIDLENKRIVAKEKEDSSRKIFHVNINNIPDNWQQTKGYSVLITYWTKYEKGLTTVEHVATAKKKIPGPDCFCQRLLPTSNNYKCTLKHINPNSIRQKWDNLFAKLWEASFISLDPWSSGVNIPEYSLYP